MDIKEQFQKLNLQKDIETYTSATTSPSGCFCDGRCEKLGYCPNTTVNETASEKARRIGVPLVDKAPKKPQNPVIAVCGQCSREIRAYNNMSCMNSDCPCGLGPIPC